METAPNGKTPPFPVHVLKETGGFAILDGWEIFHAAQQGKARKINLVIYEKGAIRIKTPVPGFSYINYAGTEKRYTMDKDTGVPKMFNTVPTTSYGKVYALGSLPEIPLLDASGRITQGYDTADLERWFAAFCEEQSYLAYHEAAGTWETAFRTRPDCRNILIAIPKREILLLFLLFHECRCTPRHVAAPH